MTYVEKMAYVLLMDFMTCIKTKILTTYVMGAKKESPNSSFFQQAKIMSFVVSLIIIILQENIENLKGFLAQPAMLILLTFSLPFLSLTKDLLDLEKIILLRIPHFLQQILISTPASFFEEENHKGNGTK